MEPKVSIFWINYNSMHVINVVKASLNALMRLKYPSYEVVVVDNGSTDGSFEVIEDHLRKTGCEREVKLVKLSRNIGFAGGANAAYRIRDGRSKYVAIVNNDAIPSLNYLKDLVTFMESHEDVGAVQGIVLRLGSGEIDSAGGFIDEYLNVHFPFAGKTPETIRKPMYVSFVEGTMPLYRVEAIKRSLKHLRYMYVPYCYFYYLEDVFLSLMLWNNGYTCIVLPAIAGRHYRQAAIKKYLTQVNLPYYATRNRLALLYMTNSKGMPLMMLRVLRQLLYRRLARWSRRELFIMLREAFEIGKRLKEEYGTIDIYKAPLLKTSLKKNLRAMLTL
ncbi:MAG: glycosyltransferase family 2 protein [Candidatus Bathyarchaeia archaeon]